MPLLLKINHGSVADHGLESYLLSRRDNEQVTTLKLSSVRRLFDHVLAEYPQLDASLSTAAAIINNQPLESGIVKMQRHEALNDAERSACVMFRLANSDLVNTEKGPRNNFRLFAARSRDASRICDSATWTSVSFLRRQMNASGSSLLRGSSSRIYATTWSLSGLRR
ncbi:hypothetical protein JG688_00016896 [Phytophthora aleatoria]|uniref:Uncharacterized protein n=1 Tax=Phytophthora aleatoria TaxID=2496075 RepID=A0A8J5M1Q6_9STRA|nr:hypothetical protein JG688_00016896 [Phytophthora aleatoria]